MKKNFKTISKLFLVGAVMTTGLAFTSCSDDVDDAQTTDTQMSVVSDNSLNGIYSYSNSKDGTLSLEVKKNGDVAVSRSLAGSGVVNGKMVYDTDYSGHLEMEDETLSAKQIPFLTGAGMIRLDFIGTGDFSNNSVVLQQASLTRGDENTDLIPGVLSKDNAKSLLLKATKALLNKGVGAIFGETGTSICSPLLDKIFPSDTKEESEELKQIKEIESQLNLMDSHIQRFADMYHKENLTEKYKNHWETMNSLRQNIEVIFAAIQANPDKKDDILQHQLPSLNVGGNTFLGHLLTMLQSYSKTYGGDNAFKQLDEYLITSYPFLSQSTGERYLYRAEDLKTLTEATIMMVEYCKAVNIPSMGEQYKTALEGVYDFYRKNAAFDAHDNEIVCTIKDAYCVMAKDAGVKTFGEKEFEKGKGCGVNSGDDMSSKAWAYYYVFSNQGIRAKKNELQSQCLTVKEAKAISAFYGGKRKMYDILTNVAGMEGLTDENAVMLLGDWAYPDWDHHYLHPFSWDHVNCYMMTKVWKNKNNQCDENYKVDDIYATNVWTWKSHWNNSWAYHTKVSKHFTGESGYNDFIDYLTEVPETYEEVVDNPECDVMLGWAGNDYEGFIQALQDAFGYDYDTAYAHSKKIDTALNDKPLTKSEALAIRDKLNTYSKAQIWVMRLDTRKVVE